MPNFTSVKRLEKQLPSKGSFSSFLPLNCSNFGLKDCERPYSYQKCEKKIKFGRICGDLESKKSFQRQKLRKYLKVVHVCM